MLDLYSLSIEASNSVQIGAMKASLSAKPVLPQINIKASSKLRIDYSKELFLPGPAKNEAYRVFSSKIFHRQFLILTLFTLLVVVTLLFFPLENVQNAWKYPVNILPKQAWSVGALDLASMEDTIYDYSVEDVWSDEEKKRAALLQKHARFLLQYKEDNFFKALYDKFMNMEKSEKLLLGDLERAKYRPHLKSFEEALNWWIENKKYEPQVMNDLLDLVKGKIDKHINNNDTARVIKPYRTCAVVGSSGILLSKSYGNFIDKHDMVMRINNGITDRFEEHVGSKTDISFMNSNVLGFCSRGPFCNCYSYGDQVPIIVYVCQVKHLIDISFCQSPEKAPLILTDPKFDTLCMRIAKYYSLKNFFEKKNISVADWSRDHDGIMFHYSSGMQAVMLALGICENVDLFGFGKSANAKHHYHNLQWGEFSLHDYDAEYIFYSDLAKGQIESIPFLNQAGFSIPPVRLFQ